MQALGWWHYESDEAVNYVRAVLRIPKDEGRTIVGALPPALLQLGCGVGLDGDSLCWSHLLNGIGSGHRSLPLRVRLRSGEGELARSQSGKRGLATQRSPSVVHGQSPRRHRGQDGVVRALNRKLGVLAGDEDASGAALRRIRIVGLSGEGAVVRLQTNASASMHAISASLSRLALFGQLLGRIAVRPRTSCHLGAPHGQTTSSSRAASAFARPTAASEAKSAFEGQAAALLAARCRHAPSQPCCSIVYGPQAYSSSLAAGGGSHDPRLHTPSVPSAFLEWRLADLAESGQATAVLRLQQLPRDATVARAEIEAPSPPSERPAHSFRTTSHQVTPSPSLSFRVPSAAPPCSGSSTTAGWQAPQSYWSNLGCALATYLLTYYLLTGPPPSSSDQRRAEWRIMARKHVPTAPTLPVRQPPRLSGCPLVLCTHSWHGMPQLTLRTR